MRKRPSRLARLGAVGLALFSLPGCAHHHARPAGAALPPDPRVEMLDGRLRNAALECAARGYAWVVRTGPTSAYCLYVNLANEPEAVAVQAVLSAPSGAQP